MVFRFSKKIMRRKEDERVALCRPPQWAVKAMNRATADNQSAQAQEEGLEPTKEWVKDLVDEILADEFASPDLELTWLDEDTDAKDEQTQFEARVKIGAATLNELRDSLGLDPFDTPAADRPMVLTATGYVPIEANVEGQGAGAENAPTRPSGKRARANANREDASLVQKYSVDQPRVPAGNSEGGQWTKEDAGAQSAKSTNDSDAPLNHGAPLGLQYAALDTGVRTDATDAGAPTDPAATDSDNGNGVRLAGDTVTPEGFTIEHLPGKNPLDPQGLNGPISPEEQQKIADALTLIVNGDTAALYPHPYKNFVHPVTGAVLPPPSLGGYITYDVPGFSVGRGLHRLIVDIGTGVTYYTNTHYHSFYPVQLHPTNE